MFVRRNKNRSGSISVQIVSKQRGRYRVLKTLGSSSDPQEVERLYQEAQYQIKLLSQQPALFASEQDAQLKAFISLLSNAQVRVIGPQLLLGSLFDKLGFSVAAPEDLFRHLVVSRLAYPGSKSKTVDYLQRYQGEFYSVDSVYRFMDRLGRKYKDEVERCAFEYSRRVLGGKIGVVFYDMTTLYFESADEDDLRRTGFSKDGKAQNPQILLGLLVGMGGYPIGYEIFEGNTFEGHTLLSVLEAFQKRFNLGKPVVVADAGLLSKENIAALLQAQYEFILGARLKNEGHELQHQIKELTLKDGQHREFVRTDGQRLIVHYSQRRAAKDQHNRQRGLKRLEKLLRSGKLTKGHINNRGYNKYLRLQGEVLVSIDYEKYEEDGRWDGLKGYVTNAKLPAQQVIEQYKNLWHIERAFRISKTDLQIRPIYHRLRHRIEAHICICFVAYTIYKELERRLTENKAPMSAMRAIQLTQTMYQLTVQLPDSGKVEHVLLKMTPEQRWVADFTQNLQ